MGSFKLSWLNYVLKLFDCNFNCNCNFVHIPKYVKAYPPPSPLHLRVQQNGAVMMAQCCAVKLPGRESYLSVKHNHQYRLCLVHHPQLESRNNFYPRRDVVRRLLGFRSVQHRVQIWERAVNCGNLVTTKDDLGPIFSPKTASFKSVPRWLLQRWQSRYTRRLYLFESFKSFNLNQTHAFYHY